MTRLWADLETRSPIPIKEGTYKYAEMVEILLFIYAFDDGDVQVWDVASGAPMPGDLHAALLDVSVELAFHHATFDRTVLQAACGQQYPLNPERFFCTMTAARMSRLPGSLDALCKALGLPEGYAKKDGSALIKKFCIPGPYGHYVEPWDAPAEWQRFIDYAVFDVRAMRECMSRIPNVLNETERVLYAYTALMNDRGIRIDRQLAVTCSHQASKLKSQFKDEAKRLTGDDEFNVISQQALLGYLRERGVFLEDARLSTLQDFLESEQASLLPSEVTKLLSTRLKANKAAVAKFPAVIKRLNRDDRLRGLIAHAGAGNTHRDTSVGPQFQNLARPVLLSEKFTMDEACQIALDGTAELYFEDPMQLLSDCVRGMVIPDPGKKLCVADLSNIEGRSVVWLAREEWKLQYFRDFDAKRIPFDNYVAAYAKAFNISPVSVTKAQRQVGKVLELACFGSDTRLLTNNGAKRIVDVTTNDLLWDGKSWVKHQGVIYKGLRPTMSALGCQVTEDHLLLVGQEWKDAKTVLTSPSILIRALETGSENLPYLQRNYKPASTASKDESENLSPVFDVLNCGPANRYTVLTDRGPLIAHNCSYGGSIGAFITFAAIYRVDLDAMSRAVREAGDPALWADCEGAHAWFEEKKMTYGLSADTWVGCYYLVKAWRAAHAAVVESWTRSEEAFKGAIRNPGAWFEGARDCHFINQSGWVFARLPSGRMMVFPNAREENDNGRKSSITFMGVSAFTRKWGVQRTYGGRLVENLTQSFARDVLLWSVPAIEQAGYPVVLRVHDELVTEVPDEARYSGHHLAQMMSAGQAWCPGLPLAAVGEDLTRYQK